MEVINLETINSLKDLITQLNPDERFILLIGEEKVEVYIKDNSISFLCKECKSKIKIRKTFDQNELRKWLKSYFTKEFDHEYLIDIPIHSKIKVIVRKRLYQETHEYREEHMKSDGIDVFKEFGLDY